MKIVGVEDLCNLTQGKVDRRGAGVIMNMLDEIGHRIISVQDLEELSNVAKDAYNKSVPRKDKVKEVVGTPNPAMVKELNNTLELIMSNTKRSNRETMQKASEEVIALIKKFS